MHKLAITLRTAQLVAHNAHNLVAGPSFFADHDFLGDLYAEYETDYDAIIERYVASGAGSSELQDITRQAGIGAGSYQVISNESAFRALCGLEGDIKLEVESLNGNASLGTQNLLQGIADKSEVRTYKLCQRITS